MAATDSNPGALPGAMNSAWNPADAEARADAQTQAQTGSQASIIQAYFERLRARPVVLEAQGLGKDFPSGAGSKGRGVTTALRDISFKVHRREFLSIIGPSGCGKSTLIRLVAGLEERTTGSILLEGREVEGPGPDRGMVFQGYTLFPWLTVLENVMFGPKASGRGHFAAESEARQWVQLIGLEAFADAYPHQLSGGMKQRVAIARALANQPRILLMDEPFGALDAQTRARMQAHLLEIWRNIDITVLFITHDLDEAIYLSDRILVLKAHPGEVQELIEVPVPRPRHAGQFQDPLFQATRRRLDALIHPPEAKDVAEAEPPLRMVRLTAVGDDVEAP